MARYVLKNMKASSGANFLTGIREMRITESIPEIDLTAAGDSWASHGTGIPSWTATLSMLADDDAGAYQTLRAGDSITFSGYPEGDGSGKKYMTGTATVLEHELGGSHDADGGRSYSLKGNGALTISTVSG